MIRHSINRKWYESAQAIGSQALDALSSITTLFKQNNHIRKNDIDIKIEAIRRVPSNKFEITLATDELKLLRPYLDKKTDEKAPYRLSSSNKRQHKNRHPVFSINALKKAAKKAKLELENSSETNMLLTQHVHFIDNYLNPKNKSYVLSEFRIGEIKAWSLGDYINQDEAHHYESQILAITRNYLEMSQQEEKKPSINLTALKLLLLDLKTDLLDAMAINDHRLEALHKNIHAIDRQIAKLQTEHQDLHSFFEVDVTLSNNSKSNILLHPVALTRIYVSENNYVDLSLQMRHYPDEAELSPTAAAQLIHYRSKILHSLPIKDQTQLSIFWAIAGHARFFNLDTKQRVYVSNKVTFTNNGKQRILFDRLKEAAISFSRLDR